MSSSVMWPLWAPAAGKFFGGGLKESFRGVWTSAAVRLPSRLRTHQTIKS